MLVYRANLKLVNFQTSPEGRVIRAVFKNLTVVSVYGYPRKDNKDARNKAEMFQQVIPSYIQASDQNLVMMGDFNDVISESDRDTRLRKRSTGSISNTFLQLVWNLKFHDTFRVHHRGITDYTYIHTTSSSRIDQIYVSNNLAN